MIRAFSSSSNIFHWFFTSFLFYMLTGGMFRCISRLISRSAGFVRPSGLLFLNYVYSTPQKKNCRTLQTILVESSIITQWFILLKTAVPFGAYKETQTWPPMCYCFWALHNNSKGSTISMYAHLHAAWGVQRNNLKSEILLSVGIWGLSENR